VLPGWGAKCGGGREGKERVLVVNIIKIHSIYLYNKTTKNNLKKREQRKEGRFRV
jgi:hypothetical protein